MSDPIPASAARARLRKALRERRAALSASERVAAAWALVAQLERIPEFLTDRRIAGYWAVRGELPLAAVLHGLYARGQVWHLPVIDAAQKTLRFAAWRPGMPVAVNRHGIPEPQVPAAELLAPEQIDVVLLPLLGFDRRGYRLGSGGGYYDRTFAFLRDRTDAAKPLLVGVGHAMQEIEPLDAQPWDVRLDYIATERELIDLTQPPGVVA